MKVTREHFINVTRVRQGCLVSTLNEWTVRTSYWQTPLPLTSCQTHLISGAFRRNKNIRDLFVRGRLLRPQNKLHGTSCCGRSCHSCPHTRQMDSLSFPLGCFEIQGNFYCTTRNVAYAIVCVRCHKKYKRYQRDKLSACAVWNDVEWTFCSMLSALCSTIYWNSRGRSVRLKSEAGVITKSQFYISLSINWKSIAGVMSPKSRDKLSECAVFSVGSGICTPQ
jgi:hypothetical protein